MYALYSNAILCCSWRPLPRSSFLLLSFSCAEGWHRPTAVLDDATPPCRRTKGEGKKNEEDLTCRI